MNFYQRVQLVCNAIPKGNVATYGQIALLCGKPRNARQVGYALGHDLAGDVPAYRVVNSRGLLSGAAAFETAGQQRMLLKHDGIRVDFTEDGWKVALDRYGWKHTFDDALWFSEEFKRRGI